MLLAIADSKQAWAWVRYYPHPIAFMHPYSQHFMQHQRPALEILKQGQKLILLHVNIGLTKLGLCSLQDQAVKMQ